jgi:hypothetical protein
MLRRSAILKAAPFVLGAAAAAAWLRRRRMQPHLALPERAGIEPPPVPSPAVPPLPPLWREPDPPEQMRPHATGRFTRRPIDIVTVVDDLLGAAR